MASPSVTILASACRWLAVVVLTACATSPQPAEPPAHASVTAALTTDAGTADLPAESSPGTGAACTTWADCPPVPGFLTPCVDGECRSLPAQPGDCLAPLECDDGNPGTFDKCVAFQCVHVQLGCGLTTCSDGDPCTIDSCAQETFCVSTKIDPNCCSADWQCDDLDPCTQDTCVQSQCKHQAVCCPALVCPPAKSACEKVVCVNHQCVPGAVPGCCLTDAECGDGNDHTLDSCVGNACQHSQLPGTCTGDLDAKTACDDGNGCTIDYCSNGWCRHTPPKSGCCQTAADCDDGCDGTLDKCQLPVGGGSGWCQQVWMAGQCDCSGGGSAQECNDMNKCTEDVCTKSGKCLHMPVPGCCLDKSDCDDGDTATVDWCLFNECAHSEGP